MAGAELALLHFPQLGAELGDGRGAAGSGGVLISLSLTRGLEPADSRTGAGCHVPCRSNGNSCAGTRPAVTPARPPWLRGN